MKTSFRLAPLPLDLTTFYSDIGRLREWNSVFIFEIENNLFHGETIQREKPNNKCDMSPMKRLIVVFDLCDRYWLVRNGNKNHKVSAIRILKLGDSKFNQK